MISKVRFIVYIILLDFQRWWLRKIYGMDIGYNVRISRHATLDKSVNPKGMHIGDNTFITGNVMVMVHDHVRKLKVDTYIGKNCFIGGGYYYARCSIR